MLCRPVDVRSPLGHAFIDLKVSVGFALLDSDVTALASRSCAVGAEQLAGELPYRCVAAAALDRLTTATRSITYVCCVYAIL